jgi:dienelactone hydrolase
MNEVASAKPATNDSKPTRTLPMKHILLALCLSTTLQAQDSLAEKLIQEGLEQYKAFIVEYDTDKDGKLDGAEKRGFFDKRIAHLKEPIEKTALAEMDTDKDGKLSVEECWKGSLYAGTKLESYIKDKVDQDKDGQVSEKERLALAEKATSAVGLKVIREFHKERLRFDKNGDGRLTGAEMDAARSHDVGEIIRGKDNGPERWSTEPWDGVFTDEERAALVEEASALLFHLTKLDSNQDGSISEAEEGAGIIPLPERRTLTSTAGTQMEATLLDASANLIVIRRSDGRRLIFEQSLLSQPDRDHIAQWLKAAAPFPFKPLELDAKDGTKVSADFYDVGDKSKPVILYCHRAGSSRGEYRVIASILARRGFNGLALDQRSGEKFDGVPNETQRRIVEKNPKAAPRFGGIQYDAAKPDIEAGLAWVKAQGFTGPLIFWGSSYSSSFAILFAAERPEIKAVLAFAPGEWLKSNGAVTAAAQKMTQPILVIHPEGEKKVGQPVYDAIASTQKQLVMHAQILHGSNELLRGDKRDETWKAVLDFLTLHTSKP